MTKEVSKLIRKWKPRLFLQEWTIEVSFSNKEKEDTIAEVCPCPTYLQAHITIYPLWRRQSPLMRERAIVHELSHCVSQELMNIVERQANDEHVSQGMRIETLERLTQRIANIAQGVN